MRATAAPVVPRRERFVIVQTPDTPAPYPRLERLPDGRLLAGVPLNTAVDFFVHGEVVEQRRCPAGAGTKTARGR
jgi:hypothetical protein